MKSDNKIEGHYLFIEKKSAISSDIGLHWNVGMEKVNNIKWKRLEISSDTTVTLTWVVLI